MKKGDVQLSGRWYAESWLRWGVPSRVYKEEDEIAQTTDRYQHQIARCKKYTGEKGK